MPIYDYTCSACGHLTEVVHGIHDYGPKFCPECGAEGTMTKGFALPAIHFKGSGWAKKDRSSSRASAAKKDEATAKTGSGSDGGSGSESGSESTSSTGSAGSAGSAGSDGGSASSGSAAPAASGD